MQQFLDRFNDLMGSNLPGLLAALLVLIVGWLLAFAVAAIVRGVMKRTQLDDRLAIWLGSDTTAPHDTFERWIPRGAYYLVLLFVLVAFLQTLGLTIVTEPLNALLNRVFDFAPRILGALLLLGAAWLIGTVLRAAVYRILIASKVEERLGAVGTLDKERRVPIAQTLGDAVYWLIFLLFLPPVLASLGLQDALGPVQSMMDEVLGFLPNLFAAVLIGAAGWFIARIIQQIVSNLLAALGVDQLGESVGLEAVLGKQNLSGIIGLVAYVLILIPVLVSALNALELTAITQPASDMLSAILAALPLLFAAGLLLSIAYIVGRVVGGLINNLLTGIGFDQILGHLGIATEREEGDRTPSEITGYLVQVTVIVFASVEASRLLGFDALADLAAQFLGLAGQVLLGLVIFAAGLYLSNLAGRVIESSQTQHSALLAMAARASILTLAGFMALNQAELASDIVNLAFGIVLGAIALALGLAFGLGGREVAARQLEEWKRMWDAK